MIINQKYISYDLIKDEKNKVILIRSEQGTGKSTMFKIYIKEYKKNFIFIASRISLLLDQKEKYDKMNIKSKLYTDNNFIQNNNIFICINSLLKLKEIKTNDYIIFIDEIQSVIETLLFTSNIDNKKRIEIFKLLIKIINNSFLIIGVKSEISSVFIKFIKDYTNKEIKLIINKYKNIKI